MFVAKLIAASAIAMQQVHAVVLESGSVPFWPYPSGEVIVGTTHLRLKESFSFKTEGAIENTNSILKEAFERYLGLIAASSGSDIKSAGEIE